MEIPNIVNKFKILSCAVIINCSIVLSVQSAEKVIVDESIGNPLLYALAWKQTAAEYRALYFQGFNIARLHVQNAIDRRVENELPLAIVSDVDDTLVHAMEYWARIIEKDIDFFDDSVWDQWIAENKNTATPGALEFLKFCHQNQVEIFYVTSRDQGSNTYQYALNNLQSLGFPNVDQQHLIVLRETSNKEVVQNRIAENHQIVVFLGDNLNDFGRKYYSTNVEERQQLMEEDKDQLGFEYILFPNPTDGHWIRAIFGESEPPATQGNREILKEAAKGNISNQ